MFLGLLALCATASAQGAVLHWEYADYPLGDVGGVDGWQNGYSSDHWVGYEVPTGGRAVGPQTDDGGDRAWGAGGGFDNWLVHEDIDVRDLILVTTARTDDDDTLGIVFHHTDAQHYYALFLTGFSAGSASDGWSPLNSESPVEQAVLVKLDGGPPQVLAEVPLYVSGGAMRIVVAFDDGVLWAGVWNDLDADWTTEPANLEIYAEDPEPLGAGKAGFYSYQMGNEQEGTYFGPIQIYAYDADEDGVPDDDDNCEFEPNADQADDDHDGIGNVCDDEAPVDTALPVDTGEPVDTGVQPDGDYGDPPGRRTVEKPDRGGVTTCGCASPAPVALLPVWMVALIRRRRYV